MCRRIITKSNQSQTNLLWRFFVWIIILFLFLIIVFFVISFLLDPESFVKKWQNNFYLFSGLAVGIATILAFVVPIVIDLIKEQKVFLASESLLQSETQHAKRSAEPTLLGLKSLIPRPEIDIILEQIVVHQAILLTGEAGTGKSGICSKLIEECNRCCILIDVRRLEGASTKNALSQHLGIQENIVDVITRLGNKFGCLLIIDQLDTVCKSPLGQFMVDIAIECKEKKGVSVLVVSRQNEIEENLLRSLLDANFYKITCEQLPEELVRDILLSNGVQNCPENIIQLGKNVSMLDIICSIANQQKLHIEDNNILDDISLWETYINLFIEREKNILRVEGNDILQVITKLAIDGLNADDRCFMLSGYPTAIENRICSQGLITRLNTGGRRYAFKVEHLQDHLFARYATHEGFHKWNVEKEINSYHLRNILLKMADFYKRDSSPLYKEFLKEVFSG